MKPVLIVWEDAATVDEWEEIPVALKTKLHTIGTLGWLLGDDADSYFVAHNWDQTGEQVSQHVAIPRGWIRGIFFLPELSLADLTGERAPG